MEIDSNVLGGVIKEQRKELKMTQKALANVIGTSQGYIADLENGKKKNPTSGTLIKLADALKISREELILTIVPDDMRKQIIEDNNANYISEEELAELINSLEKEDIKRFRDFFLASSYEEISKRLEMIANFDSLSLISQQTVLNLISSLEIIDKAKNEQASESEVG